MLDKKSVLLVFSGYIAWGFQPLYWNLLVRFDPMFNLAMRIVWSVVFMTCVIFATKKGAVVKAVWINKKQLMLVLLGALFLLLDFVVYMEAVQTGHVLDVSLGYYMGPFVTFALSMALFKEKPQPLTVVAMVTALAGVAISIISYGSFSYITILLSILFAVYGAFKKIAAVEPTVSYAYEMVFMAPLAIFYLIFFPVGTGADFSLSAIVLLVGTSVVTCLPMMLYAMGVLKLPFVMMGFMQYISPSLGLACGLLLGEQITPDKLATFLFIWAGMALYLISMVREERKRKMACKVAEQELPCAK